METLVAFEIKRGGKFNNPGHLTVKGFDKQINHYLETDCTVVDGVWYDNNGNSLELNFDNDGTGRAEFDGDYDTIYVKKLTDCNNNEISVIWNDSYGYDRHLADLNIKDFEILRVFKIKASDVFCSDDITDTLSADENNIEEINEDVYYESDYGYNYEVVNGKYYRQEI